MIEIHYYNVLDVGLFTCMVNAFLLYLNSMILIEYCCFVFFFKFQSDTRNKKR